ncbi:hypothetical protein MOUN0_H00738 [Monosporozyma unispora]
MPKTVIPDSSNGKFRNSIFKIKNVLSFVNELKERYTSIYSGDKKDRLWKKILIDDYCNDPTGYENEILKLIQIEKASINNYVYKNSNNGFFCEKIIETIHFYLNSHVKIYFLSERNSIKISMKPTKFIKHILNCLKLLKLERHIFEEKDFQCEYCESRFHHSKNCLKKPRNLRPEQNT